ncbi:acyl-CoA synthetase [uncultured Jatrophihabitans sp.]|uniref:acyl-CoA synthetase n=1 Tax=uncultured Jatrophihabitans sp. TaxID=1610747 RepID=UPI0035C960BD
MTASDESLWPKSYATPADLELIEQVPLGARGLPRTTYDVLLEAARRWPDRVAQSVLPNGARWKHPSRRTFAELLSDVHRFANGLRRAGVRRDRPVGLISPNCEGLITATLAAELAGIAAPINGSLRPEHIAHMLELLGVRVLVAAGPRLDSATWRACTDLAKSGQIDAVVRLHPTGEPDPAELWAHGGGPDLVMSDHVFGGDCPSDRFEGTVPASTDIAAVFHTGGTTGVPKMAAHTHANEVSDAWMLAANTTLGPRDTVFAGLPLFHVNALIVTLLAPIMRGQHSLWAGPSGYRDADMMSDFWRIVEHHRINSMSAVPTVYSALARVPVDADISSLRSAIVGASALPPGIRATFETAVGVPLIEGYGLTEATCASARSFEGMTPTGAVGQRLAYQRVKAVQIDQDGAWQDLVPGSVGSLVITGPTVFPGYVVGRNRDGLELDGAGKLVNGWVDTGDLGRVDDDGFVFLTGRAKDLIIRGGHNIDPRTIEDALLSHPDVVSAGAVGRPDRHSGEVPIAYVTVDTNVSEDELLQWAAQHVSERAAAPKAVHIMDTLPVTAVGKPYKLALRADAARRAICVALAGLVPESSVTAAVDEGQVAVTITLRTGVDVASVGACLNDFDVVWRVVTQTTAPPLL